MARPSRGSHPSRTDWLCAGPLSTGQPRPAPGGRRHAPVREERARAFESCVAARVCQKLPVPQHLEVAASSLLKIPRAVLSSRWLKFERRVKGTERPRMAHRRENVGSSGSAARTPRPRGRCATRVGPATQGDGSRRQPGHPHIVTRRPTCCSVEIWVMRDTKPDSEPTRS